tara:strand:- start:306 stop:590 length:285 start_codon:yes stop_codon:yes gene_type:complete
MPTLSTSSVTGKNKCHKTLTTFNWTCKECSFAVMGDTIRIMDLKRRLHKKVCDHSGRLEDEHTMDSNFRKTINGTAKHSGGKVKVLKISKIPLK